MTNDPRSWVNTTHDWTGTVDTDHIAEIRAHPSMYAPSGAVHRVLEVLAYAADEAMSQGTGRTLVTLHPDGAPLHVEVEDLSAR